MRSLRCEIAAYRAAKGLFIILGMAEDGKSAPDPAASPRLEDLARRIMDLWQEQMAAIAADPDLMRQMARMMAASPFPAMMQGAVAGMMAATQMGLKGAEGAPNPYEWWKGADGQSKQPVSAAPGPAPAAAASEPGSSDVAELRRRLAGLEARLREVGEPFEPARSDATKPSAKPRAKSGAKPARARKPAPALGGAPRRNGGGGPGGPRGGAAG